MQRGVVGLILAFFLPPIGAAVSTFVWVQSARRGERNAAAITGVVVGIIGTAVFAGAFFYVLEVLAAAAIS
jgi:uncharacterized membrane protein